MNLHFRRNVYHHLKSRTFWSQLLSQIRNGGTDTWRLSQLTLMKGGVTQPVYVSTRTSTVNDLSTVNLTLEQRAYCISKIRNLNFLNQSTMNVFESNIMYFPLEISSFTLSKLDYEILINMTLVFVSSNVAIVSSLLTVFSLFANNVVPSLMNA